MRTLCRDYRDTRIECGSTVVWTETQAFYAAFSDLVTDSPAHKDKMVDKHKNPTMIWEASDLPREWKCFEQHCQFTFDGPLAAKSEEKVNYLMTYIGDKGREIYTTFTFRPAAGGQAVERDTLAGVFTKYHTYVAPRHGQLRATFIFNQRKQGATEKFDSFARPEIANQRLWLS